MYLEEGRYQEIATLLPVVRRRVGEQDVFTVAGRDIQRFLDSTDDPKSWRDDQGRRGQLIENRDYIILREKPENSGRGRPSLEGYYTFDAAKKICMMSEKPKGDEVREYFLECERRAHGGVVKFDPPSNPLEAFHQSLHYVGAVLTAYGGRLDGLEVTVGDFVKAYHFDQTYLKESLRREQEARLRLEKRESRRLMAVKNHYKQTEFADAAKRRFQELWTCTDCMMPSCDEKDLFRRRMAQFDHVIPTTRHGRNSISNMGLLCFLCNSEKRDKLIKDYRPAWLIAVLKAQEAEWHEEWRKRNPQLPLL